MPKKTDQKSALEDMVDSSVKTLTSESYCYKKTNSVLRIIKKGKEKKIANILTDESICFSHVTSKTTLQTWKEC